MTSNWLPQQVLISTNQWDKSLTLFYPEAKLWMKDPVSYLDRLTVQCNYLNSAKLIDWNKYLSEKSLILDVGCGGGWLSAYLSSLDNVSKIYAIDSSSNYLENYLPSVVKQLDGDISKIETVQGLFTPILLNDKSVDLIVASAAIHHADNVQNVLEEFYRVLKPSAFLVILNESFTSNSRFIYQSFRTFASILLHNIRNIYKQYTPKIFVGGFLYDPYLGDNAYSEWYWKGAIKASGFDLLELMNTKLPTVKNSTGSPLRNFICRKK